MICGKGAWSLLIEGVGGVGLRWKGHLDCSVGLFVWGLGGLKRLVTCQGRSFSTTEMCIEVPTFQLVVPV